MNTAIISNLPALQVVIPLFGALICALLKRGSVAWFVTMVICLIMPIISITLLISVLNTGPISYSMGGWAPPFGIEYKVDVFNAFILVLVSGIGAVVLPYARLSVASEIKPENRSWFYSMFLLCLTGLLGITITGDAFNAFVFLEISSLSTYVLIAMGRDRRALLAAYQYLILGSIGATFYIIGVGIIYTLTGTLNFADLAARISEIEQTRSILAAAAFIVVGISLKFALFPLHVWLPNAYAYSPSTVSAFLASTATKVALYLLIRFLFSIFGIEILTEKLALTHILIILSLAAMLGASTVAIFQHDVKRLFAYSSVAQIGYITLGIALANQAGLTGSLVHIFNHAVMKGTLFLAIGAVVYRIGSAELEDFSGLGKKMPITMSCLLIGGLGLIGVPGTAGFISKWYLAVGAIDAGYIWLVFLLVLSSLLALIYVGRVVEVVWFREPGPNLEGVGEAPLSLLVPTALMAAATIYFGLETSQSAGLAAQAVETLLAGAK
jgi:multicomponent Na+:H+ antiporter subunit D